MRLKIISAILSLSLSQLIFASPTEKPNTCPSVSALQAVNVSDVIKADGHWYGFVKSNNYGTNDKWSFVIGEFSATNKNDAKQQILRAVNSLNFVLGPSPFEIQGQESWVCAYKDGSGHSAATVTPVLPFFRSLITHH
ncbi:DUF4949 domain-containing protein [Legionella gresilensis]|uniref:DUF4949 domain-containing protein n=1 Tax=Legionella gresilensis TaxID=91823 RepID=UPI001041AE05|nr:DUF4949 domain-containing protein [Legionella gresilensis]